MIDGAAERGAKGLVHQGGSIEVELGRLSSDLGVLRLDLPDFFEKRLPTLSCLWGIDGGSSLEEAQSTARNFLIGYLEQLQSVVFRKGYWSNRRRQEFNISYRVGFNIYPSERFNRRILTSRQDELGRLSGLESEGKFQEDPRRDKNLVGVNPRTFRRNLSRAINEIENLIPATEVAPVADVPNDSSSLNRATAPADEDEAQPEVKSGLLSSILRRKRTRVAVAVTIAALLASGITFAADGSLFAGSDTNQTLGSPPDFVGGKPVPGKCQPVLSALKPGQRNALHVTLSVKTDDTPCWTPIAAPVGFGITFRYMISYQNNSDQVQKNVVARTSLAPKLSLVPNSTYLFNSTNPNGVLLDSNNITNGGVVIGGYLPGAGAYVVFSAAFPFSSDLACGPTDIRSVGVVRPESMSEYYNTATTQTFKRC